ncbi:MAG: hypothetical protein Kow00105_02360 [Phycisphaeraceae bacterium]
MFALKTRTRSALILATALALSSSYALAERNGEGPRDGDRPHPRHFEGKPGPKGPHARGDMAHRFFGGLDLTEEQKTQIRDIMKQFGEERRAWHEAHKEDFEALRDKMRAARESDDPEAVKAVHEEIKALMESAPKPDATHDQIRALLTEEQQAKFDERVAKMRERMQQWREKHKDGPPMHGKRPPHGMGPDGGPPPHADGHRPGGRIFGNLDLTDEQKQQLRDIMQSDQTREEKMAAVRGILTEEQQAKLDANIQKMKEMREKFRDRRGDRPHRDKDRRHKRDRDRGQDEGNGQLDL